MSVMRTVLLALCAATSLTGCADRTTFVCSFPSPAPLALGDRMPDDFGISLWTYNDSTPRSAIDVSVRGDGRGDWRVWVPATKAETVRGEIHLDAAQVASVWMAVRDARFDVIDAGTPSPDVCSGGASGIERFAVRAGGAERYVWRAPDATDVDGIRHAVLALIPPYVAAPFASR